MIETMKTKMQSIPVVKAQKELAKICEGVATTRKPVRLTVGKGKRVYIVAEGALENARLEIPYSVEELSKLQAIKPPYPDLPCDEDDEL